MLSIFLLLTAVYNSMIHTERIVAFPLQRLLRKCTAVLHCMYIAYPVLYFLLPLLFCPTPFLHLHILTCFSALLSHYVILHCLLCFHFFMCYCFSIHSPFSPSSFPPHLLSSIKVIAVMQQTLLVSPHTAQMLLHTLPPDHITVWHDISRFNTDSVNRSSSCYCNHLAHWM